MLNLQKPLLSVAVINVSGGHLAPGTRIFPMQYQEDNSSHPYTALIYPQQYTVELN